MKLLTMIRSRLMKLTTDAQGQYRAIIARADNPKPGDAEALASLAPVLGFPIDEARVARDAAVLRQVAELTPKAEALDKLLRAAIAAEEAENAYAVETQRMVDARAAGQHAAYQSRLDAQREWNVADDARVRLAEIRREHADLLSWTPDDEAFVGPPVLYGSLQQEASGRLTGIDGESREDFDVRVQLEMARVAIDRKVKACRRNAYSESGHRREVPIEPEWFDAIDPESFAHLKTARREALMRRDGINPDTYRDKRTVAAAREYLAKMKKAEAAKVRLRDAVDATAYGSGFAKED